MTKKIIIEKIIIYTIILILGVLCVYAIHLKETGYTDRAGNYIKGTLEIAEENKQNYIMAAEAYGFVYQDTTDSYITLKKDATISSLIKINADFYENTVKDCFFDIYFARAADYDVILKQISDIAINIDFETQFNLGEQLKKFNAEKQTLTVDTDTATLELKPVDGFSGVVISLRTKN